MMWNALVSVLLLRASIVMIDGNPAYPDISFQWRVIEETRPTFFGLSPAFTMACRKEGLEPGRRFDLSSVRMVCEAGSPLPLEGYEWLYEQFGPDVNVNVGSGGTDVCTGIVQGIPLLPVYAGEMSTRMPGADVDAFGPDGTPVVGELGELVIKQPMPSMPVCFWNDPDGSRYRQAYFEHYPGVWRFGDWVLLTERGSAIITGRSDATLNRGGVRLGSSEIYSVVEEIDEVLDSLVVHLEEDDELLLFVVLRPGVDLDDGAPEADRGRPPERALAPPCAGHDRGGARDPAHADREEARGPGQARPGGSEGLGRGRRATRSSTQTPSSRSRTTRRFARRPPRAERRSRVRSSGGARGVARRPAVCHDCPARRPGAGGPSESARGGGDDPRRGPRSDRRWQPCRTVDRGLPRPSRRALARPRASSRHGDPSTSRARQPAHDGDVSRCRPGGGDRGGRRSRVRPERRDRLGRQPRRNELDWYFRFINEGVETSARPRRVFITQIGLEPVLLRAAERVGAEIRYASDAVSVEQDDSGVSVVVEPRDGGAGAHRAGRLPHRCGRCPQSDPRAPRHPPARPRSFSDSITIYFKADVRRLMGDRNLSVVYVLGPRLQGFFRFSIDLQAGFLVVNSTVGEDGTRSVRIGEDMSTPSCIRYVREALGDPEIPVEMRTCSAGPRRRSTPNACEGRVFLAGDSAHVMPPTGGFGGNSGVQDGYDLAWKLAYVLDGRADETLLDTYDPSASRSARSRRNRRTRATCSASTRRSARTT